MTDQPSARDVIAGALCDFFEKQGRVATWREWADVALAALDDAEFVVVHRDELNAGIRTVLYRLNHAAADAVSLMTNLGIKELDDLGGLPKEEQR